MRFGVLKRRLGRTAALAAALLFARSQAQAVATVTDASDAAVFALEPAAVTARVTRADTLENLSGVSVTFFLAGSSQTAVTGLNGLATTTYALLSSSGTYELHAAFEGQGSFTASADTAAVTVSPRPTNMVPFDTSGFALEGVTPKARLLDGLSGAGLPGKALDVWFNGSTLTTTTDALGDGATTFLAPAVVSTYPFTATFLADGTYGGKETAGVVTVQGRPTTLLPDNINTSLNDPFETLVRLKDTRNGQNLAGRQVVFTFQGSTRAAVTDSVGLATGSYTAPAATGTYSYSVDFSSDATYAASAESADVVVDLRSTVMIPVDRVVPTSETFSARAQLIQPGVGGVQGKTVEFYFNGSTAAAATDELGVASVDYLAGLAPLTTVYTATFFGDNEYKASVGTAVLTITQRPTSLAAVDASDVPPLTVFLATATVTDQTSGGGVGGLTVSFFFEGSSAAVVTNATGTAVHPFTAPSSTGTFQYFASVASTTIYGLSSDSGTVTVTKGPTLLSADDVSVTAGVEFAASVTLTEVVTGDAIAGATITFSFQGKNLSAVTDSLGQAATNYTAPLLAQTFSYTASFPGDDAFLGDNDSAIVTVVKRNAVADSDPVVARVSAVWTASATLRDAINGAGIAGKTLEFVFEGSTETRVTNGSGFAASTFTAPSSSRTIEFTTQFFGDSLYNAVLSSAPVIVILPPTDLALAAAAPFAGDVFTATATLTEADSGTPMPGREIELTFEGSTRTHTTDAAGVVVASFTAPATTGTYFASAHFGGDTGVFGVSNGSAAVVVAERITLLELSSAAVDTLDLFTASATLSDSAGPLQGATISFLLDGTTHTALTDALGTATTGFTAPSSSGTYELAASFPADGTYAAASTTRPVVVSSRAVEVSAPPVAAVALDLFRASATVADKAGALTGEAVEFAFEGTTVTVLTDALGFAATDFFAPASSGTYQLVVNFPETPTYAFGTATAAVTVAQRTTELSARASTTIVAGVFTASATLSFPGGGVAGELVRFVFNGATQSALTDALGVAATDYASPASTGPFRLEAYHDETPTYTASQSTAQITVERRPTGLALAAPAVRINQVFAATATLTDPGGALPGKAVRFVFEAASQTATTGGLGSAATTYFAPASSGAYRVEAYFDEEPTFAASDATATVTVLGDETVVSGPPASRGLGQVFTASATLTKLGAAVSGETIRFLFQGATQTATTDIAGLAATSYFMPASSGTYRLEFHFDGTAVLDVSAGTAAVTAIPFPTVLSGPPVSSPALDLFVATAVLTQGGAPLAGQSVVFDLGGTQVQGVTDGVGRATASVSAPAAAAVYQLDFQFGGSGFYAAASATAAVTVTKRPTAIELSTGAVAANTTFFLTATLTDAGGGVAGQGVDFIFEGTTHTVATNGLGAATTGFAAPSSSGTYAVRAVIATGPTYIGSSTDTTVLVSPRATGLSLSSGTAFVGDLFVASATLTDFEGAVAGKTVRFVFQGTTQTATTDALGLAATSYAVPPSSGVFRLESYFDADPTYSASDSTAALTAQPLPPELSVFPVAVQRGQAFTAAATLRDKSGPLAGNLLVFLFEGAPQSGTTNGLGEATTTYFAPLSSGTYKLDAIFSETPTHAAAASTAAVVVTPDPTNLSAPPASVDALDLFVATAVMTTEGAAVVGETVTFTLNGTTHTAPTDALGVATTGFIAPAASGTYTLDLVYPGSGEFASAASTAAVTVAQRLTGIGTPDQTVLALDLFFATATLTDKAGALTGATVHFLLAGTTQSVLTDALGEAATGFFAPVSSGTYRLAVSFDEGPIYAAASASAAITVDPRITSVVPSTVSPIVNDLFFATATLTDPGGPLAGKTLSFVFEGTTRTAVTDSLGVGATSFTAPASSGPYAMVVFFSTDATYVGDSSTTVLGVLPRPTVLTALNIDAAVEAVFTASATLSDALGPVAGQTIRFVVNGTTQTALTDSLGLAATQYAALAATATFTVPVQTYLDETPVYAAAESTATLRVVGRFTEISGPPIALEVLQVFTASATLVDASTGPLADYQVNFVFTGTTQTAKTDLNGLATTVYASPPSSGTYTLELYFNGTQLHANSFSTAAVAVSPIPTETGFQVGVSSALAVFGATATLTSRGTPLAGETMRFVFSGVSRGTTTDALGSAATTFFAPASSGSYNAAVFYDGTGIHGVSSGAAILTVIQRETFMAGSSVAAVSGLVMTASATLTDRDGAVAGAGVSFALAGATRTAETDAFGVAAATFTAPLSSGAYRIDFFLPEDATYLPSSSSDTVLVQVRPAELSAATVSVRAFDVFTATAVMTDVLGEVAGSTLTFHFEGSSAMAVTNSSGVATSTFSAPASSGPFLLTVTHPETDRYALVVSTAEVSVSRRGVRLLGTNFIVNLNTPFIAVGDLTDLAASTAVTNRLLRFHFNGSSLTALTDEVGRATVAFTSPLSAGQREYSATFDGDATYASSTTVGSVFVGQTSILVAQTIVVPVGSSGTLIATLRDSVGNDLPGETVTFEFQGDFFTSVTDINGEATAEILAPAAAGDFNYTASFAGSGSVAPSEDSAIVRTTLGFSLLAAFDADVVAGRAFQAKAKLVDINTGIPISGRSVDFLYEGDGQTAQTNSEGIAAAAYFAPSSTGTTTFTAVFAGDNAFQGSSSTGTVSVLISGEDSGIVTGLTAEEAEVPSGAQFQISAALKDLIQDVPLSNRPVTFLFTSASATVLTDSLGIAKTTFTAPSSSGSYFFVAQFLGDSTFNASQATAAVRVGLLVPRDPAKLSQTAVAGNQTRLDWSAVAEATNGSALGAFLSGYRVQKALNPGGAWTTIAAVGAAALRTLTVPVETFTVFYRVVAVTTDGQTSNGENAVEVSADPRRLFLAKDGRAWVRITQGALAELEAAAGPGFRIDIASGTGEGFLRIYEFKVVKDGVEIKDLVVGTGRRGTDIVIATDGLPVSAVPQASGALAVYFDNGVEWVKLGGTNDPLLKRITVQSNSLGRYAVRLAPAASEFKLTKVVPRIFTPEESNPTINRATFLIDNPADNDVSIRIYDITGAIVRRNLARSGSNSIYWDGRDDSGAVVKGGIYIYHVEGDGLVLTGTVVVAK